MVKPIDNTVFEMPSVVGGDKISTKVNNSTTTKMNKKTDKAILIMRCRDFMNGIQNAYINDKSTSLKTDIVKPNKQTTTQFIETLQSIKDLHTELCDTYTHFDSSKGIDAKLQTDIADMISTLSQMHLTKKDKIAMIKAQHKAIIDQMNAELQQQLDKLNE